MKFGYTILYVENVLETVHFYEECFGLKQLFIHESEEYAEMETGATKLAFASHALSKLNGPEFSFTKPKTPPPFEIAFVTDQVEAAFRHAVAHGATEVKKPTKKPWGQLVAYVKDCNGILIEICSPMG